MNLIVLKEDTRTIGGIHDETQGHVDYGGGRLFTDEKRIKLISKELTNAFDNKENYIFKTNSNEVLCSKCKKEFYDEFDFCPYCGTEKPKQKICPKCKLEPSIEYSFCSKCGIELVDKEEYIKKIEENKLLEEQEKIEEEWKKGTEMCSLKYEGDISSETKEFYMESYHLYTQAKNIFNLIDFEIYEKESPINSYDQKKYEANVS